MARMNATHKPGEKSPAAGTFYCCVCSLKGIESTCDVKQGEMFLACPRCLARNVAEWDMTWRSMLDRPGGHARVRTLPWPGSLAGDA